jgi:Na+-driven multidrug efflux pump
MIHIWAGVFVFFGSAWSKWMLAENYQSTSLKMNILAMLANIILNLILIPMYGIKGAAIATFISYALGHTVLALMFKNQKKAITMFWDTINMRRIL